MLGGDRQALRQLPRRRRHRQLQRRGAHPDQHGGEFVANKDGGITLYAGNDGGDYTQTVGPSGQLTQQGFGKGANDGFHTLLPYGVAGAADGVVYAGLQDNGEMRIEPGGRQTAIYGGDGVFTLVDLLAGVVAFALERRERWRLLWLLIPQRIGYRQIMYYVVLKAITQALRGPRVGWGKLERSGRVAAT